MDSLRFQKWSLLVPKGILCPPNSKVNGWHGTVSKYFGHVLYILLVAKKEEKI
jgi:hypothetical protein